MDDTQTEKLLYRSPKEFDLLDSLRGPDLVMFNGRRYMAHSYLEKGGPRTVCGRFISREDGIWILSPIDDKEEIEGIKRHLIALGYPQPIMPFEPYSRYQESARHSQIGEDEKITQT